MAPRPGIIDRTCVTEDSRKVANRRVFLASSRRKKRLAALILVGLASAVAISALMPLDNSSASPIRETDCSVCHDTLSQNLLTVSGFPTQYTPGANYEITISVADQNGNTGENGFLLLLSGGGTLHDPGPGASVDNPTSTASTEDVRPSSRSTWTVNWTAPSSGTPSIHVWAVSATDTETGQNAPYDDVVLSTATIPEFAKLLVPILGVLVSILAFSKLIKKR